MPPVRSGIATCSADLVARLRATHDIDVFVAGPSAPVGTRPAHEFLWRHERAPYDLAVYQVGNASHHDYLWPYMVRFPGLTVLHDAHLHHARAAALLTQRRTAEYRAEFAANHPDDSRDAAELAIAGFDSHLYYLWPMLRVAVDASRLAAVHSRSMVTHLRELGYTVEHIRLSHGTLVDEHRERDARGCVRGHYGLHPEAIVFGCFGGLTPDKRVPQILDAFSAMLPHAPTARLLLGGAPDMHYDIAADVRSRGLEDRVVLTGYLDTDDALTDCIAAVDVTLNLRWPTAREISGPWLRSLAAGKPSIIIDLLQTADVPSLDPRTWTCVWRDRPPVAVAVDILDEDHSLRLAMRRLAEDAALRRALGESAQRHWRGEHSPEAMVSDYERLMAAAQSMPAPSRPLPAHLREDGTQLLDALVAPFGLTAPLGQTR
jgi:glycosyltransferase involved in cell wall biosynthesis